MNKAIFLDRDGVINKKATTHEYIKKWEEFKFLSNVKTALKKLSKTDYKIIILTNQRGISLGKMSLNDLNDIHSNMLKEIKINGGRIDSIFFCPHDIERCNCRKPSPGMLDKATVKFNIDLKNSWVVGDSDSDIELGKSRDCKTIYIGKYFEGADYNVANLNDAVKIMINN